MLRRLLLKLAMQGDDRAQYTKSGMLAAEQILFAAENGCLESRVRIKRALCCYAYIRAVLGQENGDER